MGCSCELVAVVVVVVAVAATSPPRFASALSLVFLVEAFGDSVGLGGGSDQYSVRTLEPVKRKFTAFEHDSLNKYCTRLGLVDAQGHPLQFDSQQQEHDDVDDSADDGPDDLSDESPAEPPKLESGGDVD